MSEPTPGQPPGELAAALRTEQRRRWRAGERVPAEEYLTRHPELRAEPSIAVDLIFNEYLLREQQGERPQPEEFLRRFPEHAVTLAEQIELHRALAGPSEGATLPAAAVPPAAAAWPAVPGYEILGELGRGGMGVVYQARQHGLQRLVALKMILSGAHASAEELARFRAEAATAARLAHPNIVQVHEVGDCAGLPFFSLEYCPGGTLAGRTGRPWEPDNAAVLVEALARAAQAAHDKHVVHRDLKPANVLFAEDGTPKIADFGLARRLDEATLTASGAILGTPAYMAPEQAEGRKNAVGPAADVYALGAILYELLTGRPPFHGSTPTDVILQLLADDPAPPHVLNPAVPRDLETIALKCLQKDPARRYASAAALADDLRRFRAGEPIHGRRPGAVRLAARWVRRNPALALLIAFAVLQPAVLMLVLAIPRETAEAIARQGPWTVPNLVLFPLAVAVALRVVVFVPPGASRGKRVLLLFLVLVASRGTGWILYSSWVQWHQGWHALLPRVSFAVWGGVHTGLSSGLMCGLFGLLVRWLVGGSLFGATLGALVGCAVAIAGFLTAAALGRNVLTDSPLLVALLAGSAVLLFAGALAGGLVSRRLHRADPAT